MALDPTTQAALVAQGSAAQANPATMTPAQMAAVNAQAAQMGAVPGMTAAQMQGTTTTEQLDKVLNQGGPLMQQAANAGNAAAASRGLLNSSMGIQAAQSAVLQNAANLANANAQQINQTGQFNTSNQQQANQINNQNAYNQSQQNAGWQQQTNMANQQAQNAANQQNAGWQNAASQQNAGWQQQANQFNAQQSNAMSTWNAGQQNEATLKALDINSRETLANIEANYKTLMQTNSGATGMYEQMLKNLSDIQGNKDMDAGTKESAIANQLTYLRTGMSMLQNMSGITGLVTF
jgi:hypothetical protein